MGILLRVRLVSRLNLMITAMVIGLVMLSAGGIAAFREYQVEDRRIRTREMVEAALSVLRAQELRVDHGEVDLKQAKREALAVVETMRAEEDGYLWVSDYEGRLLSHPVRPDLVGKDLRGLRDIDGVPFFKELIEVARDKGGGYVTYKWPKPGRQLPLQKLAYVEPFPPWAWVVGHGTYPDDGKAIFASPRFRFMLGVLAASLCVALLAWRAAYGISRRLNEITMRMVQVADGDRNVQVPYTEREDEVGELARALKIFRDQAGRMEELRRAREAAEKRAADEARSAEERVRLLLESAGEGMCAVDRLGNCTSINSSALRLLGYDSVHQVLGQHMHALVHHSRADGSAYPPHECRGRAAFHGQSVIVDDEVFWRRDGSCFPVEYRTHPMRRNGEIVGAVITFFDVTERRQVEESMRLANAVFNAMAEAIVVCDARNRIKAVNPAFARITGYAACEVMGRDPKLLRSAHHPPEFFKAIARSLAEDGGWQGEIWNRRKSGEVRPDWVSIAAIRDHSGAILEYVALFTDITTRKRDEERIRWHANFDALTELPNRQNFLEGLAHSLERARGNRHCLALLFLDLDHFKEVNDRKGHAVGDRLLQMVAKRLRHAVRETDKVSRLGGDEFTILLENLANPGSAAVVCQKIIDSLSQPFRIDDDEVSVGVSIGVALFPDDAKDASELLKNADFAMYAAKEGGRQSYRFYAPQKEPELNLF